jgi:hypothetical protein
MNYIDRDHALPSIAEETVLSWRRTLKTCAPASRKKKFAEAALEISSLGTRFDDPRVAQSLRDLLEQMGEDYGITDDRQEIMAEAAKAAMATMAGSKPVRSSGHNGAANGSAAANAPPAASLVSRKASSYTMSAIDWFWPERFALGKLGLIGGLPDRGKGLISADLIACATNNHPLPCGEGHVPQGRVLYFTAEDDPEDTVLPRLVAAGADLDKVEIVEMVREAGSNKPRTFNLTTDLELLRGKLMELGDVVLVIIDPVSAYLGGKVDSRSTTDVRGFLMPLKDLAKEKSVSLIGIMHFNKKTDVTDAMLRIADSLAYAATARHVYCVVDDPEVEHQRLFVKAKNNAAAPNSKNLSYMTGSRKVGFDEQRKKDIWAPYLVWGQSYVDITATEAMKAEADGRKGRDDLRDAIDFLKAALANGPMKHDEITRDAKANGISERTLRRAKAKLSIESVKPDGAKAEWIWTLPGTKATFHETEGDR